MSLYQYADIFINFNGLIHSHNLKNWLVLWLSGTHYPTTHFHFPRDIYSMSLSNMYIATLWLFWCRYLLTSHCGLWWFSILLLSLSYKSIHFLILLLYNFIRAVVIMYVTVILEATRDDLFSKLWLLFLYIFLSFWCKIFVFHLLIALYICTHSF